MVKVLVSHKDEAPRAFTPSDAADLLALVSNCRHFGPGSLEDVTEVVVGRAYGLKEGMHLRWFPAPGGHRPNEQEPADQLLSVFAERLRQRMRCLPNLFAQRRAAPVIRHLRGSAHRAHVVDVGNHFKVQGLTRPTLQLLHALKAMDDCFVQQVSAGQKWTDSIQLLRLIASPGMGKSTALKLLWDELRQLVDRHAGVLRELGAGALRLVSRLANSLREDSMLVFDMDLSVHGLNALAGRETHLQPANVLAARLMFMATHDASASGRQTYDNFLRELDSVVPLHLLQPLHVLSFIKAASGLHTDDDALVVFAFDEVNSVWDRAGQPATATWFQEVLSAFVHMRQMASRQVGLGLMPLAITASTLASATTLACTSSGRSKVADLHLVPLTTEQMWAVVQDLAARLRHEPLGQGQGDTPCPQHVSEVLRIVGGNPRHLAWAVSGMSGSAAPDMSSQTMLLGEGRSLPWVHDAKAFDLVSLLNQLASLLTTWETWLRTSGDTHTLFTQIVLHGLLGRPVSRSGKIPLTAVTWQDAENFGVCSLVNYGDTAAAAASSSRTSSSGGWAVDDGGVEHWLRQQLPETALYLSGADADAQENQQVWLSPMLGVMSLRHMACPHAQQVQPPLIARLADEWQQRELTDVLMLLLRLQLLSAEAALDPGGRTSVRLSEVLPGELPHKFKGMLVELPPASTRVTPVPFPTGQLSASEFQQMCSDASYDSGFVFVGSGNSGPDGWVVLRLLGGGQLVVVVQSKTRATSRQTKGMDVGVGVDKGMDVGVEVDKCWDVPLQQLVMLVTDNNIDDLSSPVTDRRVPVVMVGRRAHQQFYGQAGTFLTACMAAKLAFEKKRRKGSLTKMARP